MKLTVCWMQVRSMISKMLIMCWMWVKLIINKKLTLCWMWVKLIINKKLTLCWMWVRLRLNLLCSSQVCLLVRLRDVWLPRPSLPPWPLRSSLSAKLKGQSEFVLSLSVSVCQLSAKETVNVVFHTRQLTFPSQRSIPAFLFTVKGTVTVCFLALSSACMPTAKETVNFCFQTLRSSLSAESMFVS